MTKKLQPKIAEAQNNAPEVTEAPLKASKPVERVNTYIAKDGDSYAAVAARFNDGSKSNFAYAQEIFEKNKGKALAEGAEVEL